MENYPVNSEDDYMKLEGWTILFGDDPEAESVKSQLKSSLERLEQTLNGVI